MLNSTRLLLVCLALGMALGCGANPTAPSPAATGAVVAGVVIGADAHVPAGLTVAVMGTRLSTVAGSEGGFQITGVPAGDVQLQFRNQDINATARLAGVTSNQFVEIRVQVNGTSAVIINEERTGKVSLCHAEGNGTYHLIDVSESAEPAHRAHGDGKIGDPVPGQPLKTFDANCRPVGPSVEIQKSTNGQDADVPPGPSIALGSLVTWRYVVTNTGTVQLTNVLVVDDRGVTVACGQTSLAPGASMTCTGTGVVTLLGPYRNVGTVTANWATATASGTLTDTDPSHYLGISPVEIEKLTNGEDADNPPGPSITVGTPVLWEYRVTNVGTVMLTGILVVDNRGVAVNCQGQTSLAPGASMTCIGSGVAVLGQYSNVGTVTASWSRPPVSGTATDSDASHYFGRSPDDDEGPKVNLCHRTGAGFFVLINVSINAEPAHLAHGDGRPGGAVPGSPGRTFSANCSVQ